MSLLEIRTCGTTTCTFFHVGNTITFTFKAVLVRLMMCANVRQSNLNPTWTLFFRIYRCPHEPRGLDFLPDRLREFL